MAKINTPIPELKLNDGTVIPMLGYGTGTAWYKRGGLDKIDRDTVEAVKTAIRLGYYHLDGAEVYNTEPELGVAIKESKVAREKLFVTTKVFPNISDIPKALDESLKKLQLDYVDLYLIHAPFKFESDSDIQRAWTAMESVKASGKARSIGVSNYLMPELKTTLEIATTPPSINQIEYHPYLQHGQLLDFQAHPFTSSTKDMSSTENVPIATAAYAPLTPVTKGKPGPIDDLLASLAKKYYVNESEICLRWCIDRGVVAITTSGKEQRLSDYLRAMTFKLTPKEVEELTRLGTEKHFRGFWTEKFAEDDRS